MPRVQLSIYGAVAEMCEECEPFHDRTGKPVVPVVGGQSSSSCVPSVIKTNVPLNDDPAHKELLLQRYGERIEKLSQQDRVKDLLQKYKEQVEKLPEPDQLINICTDAGFLNVVEIGQYFMTKDTEEFSQFTVSVACREYTLPRDDKSTDPKGWIHGNTKIGPVLEVTTSHRQGEHGVEIRIESVNKDNSHLWVRISHGLNKLVTDLINKEDDDNEQETHEMQFEEFALKTNVLAFANRSEAKA